MADESFFAQLAFRRQAKAIVSDLAKQAFKSLKTATSARLYVRTTGITYETFRLVSVQWKYVKDSQVDICPRPVYRSHPARELHPVIRASDPPGTFGTPKFFPVKATRTFGKSSKKIQKKRRKESPGCKPSENRLFPGHHPFLQHPRHSPVKTGKRVSHEVTKLTITDLDILCEVFGFERAVEWQATSNGSVQGYGIYKVIDRHTILFIEEAELIFTERQRGNSQVCLKYKSGKLNSREVLHLAPGRSAQQWKSAADAIDNCKGQSCVEILRHAGINIVPELCNDFTCRQPSTVPISASPTLTGPWVDRSFTVGTTLTTKRAARCPAATRAARRVLLKRLCVRRAALGHSGIASGQNIARGRSHPPGGGGSVGVTNQASKDLPQPSASAVPSRTDHGSQLSGEPDDDW